MDDKPVSYAESGERGQIGPLVAIRVMRAIALVVLLSLAVLARADVPIPPLKATVTDLTGTLSPSQLTSLDTELGAFHARRGSQIAVLIVPSTRPEAIEQFSIRAAESWKIGRKGIDDGVILVIAKDDRALRIEVGYGLEGTIPDAIAKRIIAEIIAPKFRVGDFHGGIVAGTSALQKLIEGEPLPPPASWNGGAGGSNVDMNALFWSFFVFAIGSVIIRELFGRTLGALAGGGFAGYVVWGIFGTLVGAILAGMAGLLISLFLDGPSGGRGGRSSGWGAGPGSASGGSGWGGGTIGGGYDGGSGSGGGFDGGGGGFGGGGASGSW